MRKEQHPTGQPTIIQTATTRTQTTVKKQKNKQATADNFQDQAYNQFQIKMAVNNLSPEEHARDLLMNLKSSNLHYSTQVTPFSI